MMQPLYRWYTLVVFLVCLIQQLSGQVAGFPAGEVPTLLPQQLRQQQDVQLRAEQIPSDNVVDAHQYRVGPGDALVVQRLDAAALEEYVIVTPENMLMVPRIGMVAVGAMTLAQVRDTILVLYRQRTPTIPVYVGLRRARSIYVTVQGNVLFPGVYTVPASMRIATLLRLAMQGTSQQRLEPEMQRAVLRAFGQLAELNRDEQLLRQDYEFLPPSSLRSIIVYHADGTRRLIDGERAIINPNSPDNPYVREGDVVVVPPERPEEPRIGIYGAVARQRTTVYRPGDRLSLLLKLGGSLLPESGAVWLVQRGRRIPVEVDSNFYLLSQDYLLEPGDIVVVDRRSQEYHSTGTVRVIGQVRVPGAYPIEPWKTHLRDVIEQAGGFTEQAGLSMAYILRRSHDMREIDLMTPNLYQERMRSLQYTNLLIEDTLRYFIDEFARRPIVACDFVACFRQGSTADNVPLADGDIIVVPRAPENVYVYGQVMKAGYIHFVAGKDAEYYIAQAGGRTELAHRGRERVIKARSGVWLPLDTAKIEPGDRIYVPHPPDEPISMNLQRLSAYIGIAGGLSGLMFSIISLVSLLRAR